MQTLLEFLLKSYPLAKRQTLKRMVQAGRVRISGRRATKLSERLDPQDKLEIVGRAPVKPLPKPTWLVYEDEDIVIVNKPAGLLTSTVPREPRPTLLARVCDYVSRTSPKARVGLIHRLDREASGLLVFSKNDAAFRSLKSQLFHRAVSREYRAVVRGVPDPAAGRIESRLIERADGTVHSTAQHGKGEKAISHFQTLHSKGKLSLLRVMLETGRKHQIRAHLRERGHPIVGDKLYSPGERAPRLMLCATKLTVVHPRTQQEMTFSVPLPEDFSLKDA